MEEEEEHGGSFVGCQRFPIKHLSCSQCDDSETGSSRDEGHTVWNQMLQLFPHRVAQHCNEVCKEDVCRAVLSCHFALDVLLCKA